MDGWAHIICALFIPEVMFGDARTMDRIICNAIPMLRYLNKVY